jgi:hypothetical protein
MNCERKIPMKRIALILALCLLLSCLSGCGMAMGEKPDESALQVRVEPLAGEAVEPQTQGLTLYELDSGVSFHALKGLDETKIENMAAYLRNGFFLVMVIQEPKTGTALEGVTLEEYGEMLCAANGLAPFTRDIYGTLATVNVAAGEGEGEMFFYYVTIHESEDSIWLVQAACPDDMAQSNVADLALWSATFRFGPPREKDS